MTKILWCTSFRPFGQSGENDVIQSKFIDCISESRNVEVDICAAQFGEAGVKETLQKSKANFFHKNCIPPKGRKYSQTIILDYGLEIFTSTKQYTHFIWSTCDFTFSDNFLESMLTNNSSNQKCSFILPQRHMKSGGVVNTFAFNFGIDWFMYELKQEKALIFKKINGDYENIGWGCFEHFLSAAPHLLGIETRNAFKLGNIIKYDNDRVAFSETRKSQIDEWNENNDRLISFLSRYGLSKLFATGSMYFLFYKNTRLADISPSLLLTLPDLLRKLGVSICKKYLFSRKL